MKNITPEQLREKNNFFYYYMVDGEVQTLSEINQKPEKPQPYLGTVTTAGTGYLWRSHPENTQGIARSIDVLHTYLLDPENYTRKKKERIANNT